MSPPIQRLVRTLVRDHRVPNAPAHATLRVHANTPAIPIAVHQIGSGTIVFAAPLRFVPASRCVLSIVVAQFARVEFPVRVTPEGALFRGATVGAPLVLRLRSSRNVRLEEALGVAA